MGTKFNADVGASPRGGKTFDSNKYFAGFCQIFTFFSPKATNLNSFGSRWNKKPEKKIEFISLKETLKMATNDKFPVYLAAIRLVDFEDVPQNE